MKKNTWNRPLGLNFFYKGTKLWKKIRKIAFYYAAEVFFTHNFLHSQMNEIKKGNNDTDNS